MKVIWTEQASADALSIYSYIAQKSDLYAANVYERILNRAERLQDQPEIGAIIPEANRSDLREVYVYSFRLIYQLLPDVVLVLSVIHGARELFREVPDEPYVD